MSNRALHILDYQDNKLKEPNMQNSAIKKCVRESLEEYFAQLGGHTTAGLYDMVLAELEEPLLEIVMKQCRGNQTKAALMLGINRGTLRKKLKTYNID